MRTASIVCLEEVTVDFLLFTQENSRESVCKETYLLDWNSSHAEIASRKAFLISQNSPSRYLARLLHCI